MAPGPKANVPLRRHLERPAEETYGSLLRSCGLLERAMQPYFGRFGISASQWGVLLALHQAASEGLSGLRLTDLSERLVIRPPSVTGVVNRLQRQGLVIRQGVATDLRARQVMLTPKARQLVARVLDVHGKKVDSVLGGLRTDEQSELNALLGKLSAHLQRMETARVSGAALER